MQVTLKVEPTIPSNSHEYTALIRALYSDFLVQVPLKSLHYVQTQPSRPVYQYDFEANDGRKWSQRIDYLDEFSGEPVLSMPVGGLADRWKVAEFQAHIEFRSLLIALTRKFGVTAVHIEWLP